MNTEKLRKIVFDGAPELKHNPDGSGTRETNPIYHGDYTIEDFEADGKIPTKQFMENPERFNEFWKFEAKRKCELGRFYPEEGERIRTARAEALKRYTGQREWPHGYTLDHVIEGHVITIGRYFTQYYEISDNKLADAMDELVAEDVRIVKQMCAAHESVLKAMDEDTEWPEMLEKANRALRIVNRPLMPEIEGKEGLARLAVQSEWAYIPYDVTDRNPLPEPSPSAWIACIKNVLKSILKNDGRTADAMEHLDALGEGYRPLREYIREKHGEDWLYAVRVSYEDLEWSIIEKLDYGENPPQTITPEIEQRIREIIDEFGEPSRKAAEKLEEGIRKFNEAMDAQMIAELESYPLSNTVSRLRAENIITDPGKRFLIQHHDNNKNLRKSTQSATQSRFEDEGWICNPVPMTKKEKVQIIAKLFQDNPDDKPSDLDLDFSTQLGMYLQKREEQGGPNAPISAEDLVRLYYCVPDDKDVGPEQIEDMKSRMKRLEKLWITVVEDRTLPILSPEDKKALNTLIGVKVKMLSYVELIYRNPDGTTGSKYLFTGIPPMWTLNKWLNLFTMTDRAIIETPKYHFEGTGEEADAWRNLQIVPEVRQRIIGHYEAEKMQIDREIPGLRLQRYKTMPIKIWILQKLAMSINYHEAHKRGRKITMDLEEAYTDIYNEEPPSKSSSKWRRFKVNFTMYLEYMILWGEIEDYMTKPRRSDIDVIYTPKARKDIAGIIEGRYD